MHFGIPIVQWQPAHSIDFGVRGHAFSSMPQLFPTQPGKVRATGSRDSVDVRVTGFSSEQSRPNLKPALRLGSLSVHGPCTGPSSSVACRGEIGHRVRRAKTSPVLTRTFHCCRSEAAHATGTARGPSEGGAAGLGVALLAAHVAAGQAGAQDGGRFGQKFQPRLVSTRNCSFVYRSRLSVTRVPDGTQFTPGGVSQPRIVEFQRADGMAG